MDRNYVDLDAKDPSWGGPNLGCTSGAEIWLYDAGANSKLSSCGTTKFAEVDASAPVELATCQNTMGYVNSIGTKDLEVGRAFCATTNDDRYALARIAAAEADPRRGGTERLDLDVTTWD